MIPKMKAKSFLAFTRQILRVLYYSAPIILTGPALACLEGGKVRIMGSESSEDFT